MIYQESYSALYKACQQMLHHRQHFAKPTIEQYVLQHVDADTENEALMSHIVAEAILKRLDRHLVESKNIYIADFDIPQIEMFYKMALAYPHIFVSHSLANQYLLRGMLGLDEVTLFEIGIGQGKQVGQLMQLATASHPGLKRVKVIALDPNPENLKDAEAHLSSLGGLSFELSYHPIEGMLESLGPDDFAAIQSQRIGPLLINSAYTIHHTAHPLDDDSRRTALLRSLMQLEPRLFTLVEPSSNHDTEDLALRLHHCWHHFGTVFELIDESSLGPEDRFSIKEKFFGREIRDIFGVSDHFRCERHEPYESWLLRLTRAGFVPAPKIDDLALLLPSYCESHIAEGIVRLGYQGMTLIAVFAYTSDRSLLERW